LFRNANEDKDDNSIFPYFFEHLIWVLVTFISTIYFGNSKKKKKTLNIEGWGGEKTLFSIFTTPLKVFYLVQQCD